MTKKRVLDRVLLLLAIKPEHKTVSLEHIYEKVHRDCGASKDEILGAIDQLVSEGTVEKVGEEYKITPDGRKRAWKLAFDEEMNKSYRWVLIARWYYKHVQDLIFPYISRRPVSVVKIFSDESDPIRKVKPIFARYAKQKPKTYNYINNSEDFWRFIDMHAIDFIPYVHTQPKAQYPDWLVIDIDAGEYIKNAGTLGFSLIKEVSFEIYKTLTEEFDIRPCVKFSGSRGFQIWITFDSPLGKFDVYRDAIKLIQKETEKRLSEKYDEFKEKYGNIIDIPITTSDVSHADKRMKKILLDWSCMKLEGDVRAPWSLHWKTCLASVPVDPKEILSFDRDDARPDNVVKKLEKIKHLFELVPSSSALLKKNVRPSLDMFFG
ncbi:MAG: hypothetical protein Q6363_006025 [Candidatus Njordarchaeota archaeon]